MKIADLTFEKLFDLVEGNQIQNPIDQKIAENLLYSERDLRVSLKTLSDFVQYLESEVKGRLTKSNLNKLMDRYKLNISQYLWEIESLTYTIEIFNLTDKEDLQEAITDFIRRINAN